MGMLAFPQIQGLILLDPTVGFGIVVRIFAGIFARGFEWFAEMFRQNSLEFGKDLGGDHDFKIIFRVGAFFFNANILDFT